MFPDMVDYCATKQRDETTHEVITPFPVMCAVIRRFSASVCCIAFVLMALAGCARDRVPDAVQVLSSQRIVEAACGQCQFKMVGNSCDLAVRMDGQCYFVDGVHIDQLGDAHAVDGFCNAIRQARVTGQLKKGRFVASSFALLPAK